MNFQKSLALLLLVFSMTQTIQAQDWAALEHFKAANASLAAAETNEDRVVFMGNSITIGWQNTQPEFFEGKPYVNRGISGQTTPQMLLRFRQDVIALHPKVVLILAGTNDIAGNTGPMTLEEIMDNLKSMTEIAMANNIQVILCSVLPAEDYPWRPGLKPNEKIPALNSMIKSYCDNSDAVYLDYFTAMANDKNGLDEELAHDGVHPTKKGYEMMAEMATVALAKVLKGK
ncbi:MAG: SGNH/GDSL hydrolase family protein [Eudoraea sp.]|nr:SGNH/GDSL hydrolase family protein [Eudoraea sp.]